MIIAFWNANMRGIDKLAREATMSPKTFWPKVILGITIPSILLYMANRDDPRWKEIPQWQKDLFWIIFVGDTIIRIPKPFEPGILFGSIPERLMEYQDTKDSSILSEAVKNAAEATNPGFIPTFLLPIIENLTNYNFFLARRLVPERLEDMPPELQYTEYTPEIIKRIGEWLNYSPLKIENLLREYTAGLGSYATDALESILKNTGVLPDIPRPSETWADVPVLKALIIRNPYGSGSASVTKFYDTLESLTEGEKYLKEMIRLNDEKKFNSYKSGHPEVMFFFDYEEGQLYSASARYLRGVSRDLASLREKQREIYISTALTPEAKRSKIEEIDELITRTAVLALDNLRAMPDEFSTETVVEPVIGERRLYYFMDIAPKYLQDYVWEHKDEWTDIGQEERLETWHESDAELIDEYDNREDKDVKDSGEALRRQRPDIDVALNMWGRVSTIQTKEAGDLLKARALELGLPDDAFPALEKGISGSKSGGKTPYR